MELQSLDNLKTFMNINHNVFNEFDLPNMLGIPEDIYTNKCKSKEERHDIYWGYIKKYIETNPNLIMDSCAVDITTFEYLYHSAVGRGGLNRVIRVIQNNGIVNMTLRQYISATVDRPIETLKKYINDNTDMIFDLGSGWGRNSIQIKKAFSDIHLVSGELSTSGCECLNLLKNKFKITNHDIIKFNFYKYQNILDYKYKNKNVIIFTKHAIEQISYISESFFNDIINFFNDVTFIHLEPVGWQITGKSNFSSTQPQTKELIGYNRNLTLLLKKMEKENKIKIEYINLNDWGNYSNTNSYTTLIAKKLKQ